MIRFTVGRAGEVLSVALIQSSGSPTLDAAALSMLRGARLPPFTADMSQAEATVNVPIRYRLER